VGGGGKGIAAAQQTWGKGKREDSIKGVAARVHSSKINKNFDGDTKSRPDFEPRTVKGEGKGRKIDKLSY